MNSKKTLRRIRAFGRLASTTQGLRECIGKIQPVRSNDDEKAILIARIRQAGGAV